MPRPSSTDKRADPLRYLRPEALPTLASILCYPTSSPRDTQPSREWLAQQRSRVEALPRGLRLNRSLSLATFFAADRGVSGRLCGHHRDLRPELVFWCYAQLSEEVGAHADRYRRYRRRLSPAGEECADGLRQYVDRVTGIATLYLGRDDFEAEYGKYVSTREDHRYRRVRGGCAACVLSVVGARAQMLIDLRASMLARKKRKTPRLLVLIEAWMDAFPTGALEMRLESEEIAEELRRFRGRIAELRAERAEQDGESRHGKRYRRSRRRRQRSGGSMSRAIAEFFGWRLGQKKKERRGSGSGEERPGSRRESSSHHGSSTRRNESSRHRESSGKAGSTYSAYPPSSRPGASSSDGPRSEYVDRHSPRPVSAASQSQVWDDGRSSPYSYYDPSYVTAHQDDIPDNAALRGSRYVSPLTPPRAPFTHNDVSQLSSSSRYSTNPYRRSFSSNSRLESTTSVDTIRPETTATSRSSSHTRPVFDPAPGQPRHTWTSRCASSVYSTDANGLRAGDDGFRARGNGYAVRQGEPELERVVEDLELEEDDVPLDPDGYDEIHCPSSDSEDGDEDGEDEADEEEQYVGARAGWASGKPDMAGSSARLCPVCQGDLSGLTSEDAVRHCNSCLGRKPTPVTTSRNGSRPTVSGIGRMVDEVIDGLEGLSTIDEAAGQFTPRPSAATRVRGDDGGRPLNLGAVRQDRADGGRSRGQRTSNTPSSVALAVSDGDLGPDDSISVSGGQVRSGRETRRESPAGSSQSSASRRSALGGGKFRHVVRDR